MSVDHAPALTVDDARQRINRTLGDPATFQRPDRWTFTKAWQRAQTEPIAIGSTRDPARYSVLLGDGDPHTVLFAIYGGDLVAECDCGAHEYHYDGTWCPHVAALWWRWAVQGLLVVTDLDADRTYHTPPPWLRVDKPARQLPSRRDARADGGERQ